MLVRLLGSEVIQRPHVLRGERGNSRYDISSGSGVGQNYKREQKLALLIFIHGGSWEWAIRTYGFFDDVKALLINLERGHLLNDLLQQDVLFVIVTFNRQLQWQSNNMHHQ